MGTHLFLPHIFSLRNGVVRDEVLYDVTGRGRAILTAMEFHPSVTRSHYVGQLPKDDRICALMDAVKNSATEQGKDNPFRAMGRRKARKKKKKQAKANEGRSERRRRNERRHLDRRPKIRGVPILYRDETQKPKPP